MASLTKFFCLPDGLLRAFRPQRTVTADGFSEMKDFLATLPHRFLHTSTGVTIYRGRNELREFTHEGKHIVVKSFCTPHLINRIAYGLLRKSKAQRSCEYAALLRAKGIGSPAPVGWVSVRHGLLFTHSYYASLRSTLPFTYIDLMEKGKVPGADELLREIGRTAGRMHEAGIIHRDFSRGNLLVGFRQGRPCVELVDLNRLRFHRISSEEGIAGFDRLPATPEMKRRMAEGYAEVRQLSAGFCLRLWPEGEAMDSHAAGERKPGTA